MSLEAESDLPMMGDAYHHETRRLKTIEQLIDFLSGTHAVAFTVISGKDACYHWIQRELVKFHYLNCPRSAKGVIIQYLMKVSGVILKRPGQGPQTLVNGVSLNPMVDQAIAASIPSTRAT